MAPSKENRHSGSAKGPDDLLAADRMLKPIAIAVPALSLGGCAPALLDPAGPVAAGEKTLLINSLAVMLGIVIPVIVATIVFA